MNIGVYIVRVIPRLRRIVFEQYTATSSEIHFSSYINRCQCEIKGDEYVSSGGRRGPMDDLVLSVGGGIFYDKSAGFVCAGGGVLYD